jgi:hypothetical protein
VQWPPTYTSSPAIAPVTTVHAAVTTASKLPPILATTTVASATFTTRALLSRPSPTLRLQCSHVTARVDVAKLPCG